MKSSLAFIILSTVISFTGSSYANEYNSLDTHAFEQNEIDSFMQAQQNTMFPSSSKRSKYQEKKYNAEFITEGAVVVEAENFRRTGSSSEIDKAGNNGVGIQYHNGEKVGIEWVNNQDWVSYRNIRIPKTGVYTFNYRIATPYSNGTIKLFVNSELKGSNVVPNTGDWEQYENLRSQKIFLEEGMHNIMLTGENSDLLWNLDKFVIVAAN